MRITGLSDNVDAVDVGSYAVQVRVEDGLHPLWLTHAIQTQAAYTEKRATEPLRALKPPKEYNIFGGFSFAEDH